jgi:hypothetical protein
VNSQSQAHLEALPHSEPSNRHRTHLLRLTSHWRSPAEVDLQPETALVPHATASPTPPRPRRVLRHQHNHRVCCLHHGVPGRNHANFPLLPRASVIRWALANTCWFVWLSVAVEYRESPLGRRKESSGSLAPRMRVADTCVGIGEKTQQVLQTPLRRQGDPFISDCCEPFHRPY